MNLGGVYGADVVATIGLDTAATVQRDHHSAIASLTSLSPEIPESDDGITPDEKDRRHLSLPGDTMTHSFDKLCCNVGGSNRDDRESDWIFNVFAEDDSGTERNALRLPKRARPSPPPLVGIENRPSVTVAVPEGAQVFSNVFADRPPRTH